MGTNFYLFTDDVDICYSFGLRTDLTTVPSPGHLVHIAKISAGWLPLFQAHYGLKSVKQIKEYYDSKKFKIVDEYGNIYTWDKFKEKVLKWNGGFDGAVPKITWTPPKTPIGLDFLFSRQLPLSHFGVNKKADLICFKDNEGYEFSPIDFR